MKQLSQALAEASTLFPIPESVTGSDIIGTVQDATGADVMVTQADAQIASVRRQAVSLLKHLDTDAYAKYREIKYDADGGTTPERGREAYLFAFARLLSLSATYGLEGM